MELQAPKAPVPVFPLPNLVLFPHAVIPLRVFELRYRTMVRDALSGERVIGMGLLKPGWERDYQGSPEFYPLGCLAHFEEVEWLPNDNYHLVVRGVSRIMFGRLVREYPYRASRVEMVPQDPYSEDDPLVQSEKEALLEVYRAMTAPEAGATGEAVAPAPTGADVSYEALVNAMCMAAVAEPLEKLRLLGIDSVIERGHLVRGIAARQTRSRPPPAAPGGENN